MTTSGITAFSMTRNDIIRQAALKIQAISKNVSMDGTELIDWATNLNTLTKQYQAMGLRVWKEEEATLFLQPKQIRYSVGANGTDHCAQTDLLVQTTASASSPIGSNLLSVTSTAGFVIGYKFGVVLDGGSIFWTTIAAFTSTTVTLAAPTTDSITSSAPMFAYLADIVQPLEVYNPRRYDIATANEVPMNMASAMDWNNLQQKTAAGFVNQVFHDKQLGTSYINVWQVPSTTIQAVRFRWQKPMEIFNAASDNPDFPEEWCLTLIFNLATIMIPNYAVAPARARSVTTMAAYTLDQVTGFDREQTGVQWYPGQN